MHRVLSFAQNCKPQNKIEVAILNFDDVANFNCVFCDFIVHLILMRKVLVTKIQVKPPDVLCWGVWMAGYKTNESLCIKPQCTKI